MEFRCELCLFTIIFHFPPSSDNGFQWNIARIHEVQFVFVILSLVFTSLYGNFCFIKNQSVFWKKRIKKLIEKKYILKK